MFYPTKQNSIYGTSFQDSQNFLPLMQCCGSFCNDINQTCGLHKSGQSYLQKLSQCGTINKQINLYISLKGYVTRNRDIKFNYSQLFWSKSTLSLYSIALKLTC